jgi:hypothetical protein
VCIAILRAARCLDAPLSVGPRLSHATLLELFLRTQPSLSLGARRVVMPE